MGLLSKIEALSNALVAMAAAMQAVIDKESPFLAALANIDGALGGSSSSP